MFFRYLAVQDKFVWRDRIFMPSQAMGDRQLDTNALCYCQNLGAIISDCANGSSIGICSNSQVQKML